MSYVTSIQPYARLQTSPSVSAEPKRVPSSQAWTRWENQVVNDIFPLRRFLGGSDHGAVYLTEYKAGDAAIKLLPAVASHAEAQLAHWRTAAALSHPHLIRLFDVGRCQLGGREFLFVVMEHAEQTLAQVLAQRALNPDEVRDMLLPTLDALAFLHRHQLAHAQLKPSNLLAVKDQLKLASDTIRPTGDSGSGIVANSSYDAPELKVRGISPACDVWSLGITLVEALTQRTPAWTDDQRPSVPANLPAPFANTVRRCLSLSPSIRPTAIELETQYNPAPRQHSTPDHHPPAHESRDATVSRSFPKPHQLLLGIAGALLVSLAVWIGLQSSGSSQVDLKRTVLPAPAPVAPSIIVKSAEPSPVLPSPVARLPETPAPAPAPAAPSPSVLLEVSPDVPPAILEKIRGRLFVTVRVLVDPSGHVIGALLEYPGSSQYFARRADEAARKWQFAPSDRNNLRVWLVRFAFTRNGVTAEATAM